MAIRLHYCAEYKVRYSINTIGHYDTCDQVLDVIKDVCPDLWQDEYVDYVAECPKESWKQGIGVLESMSDEDFALKYNELENITRSELIEFMNDALKRGEQDVDYIRLEAF